MKDPPSGDTDEGDDEDGRDNPDDGRHELLIELADDIARRYRSGERPTVEEYAQAHPALADEIRERFPALLAIERSVSDLAPVTERPGTLVGRYKLLERIGEGGFGVVFMAEQQHPVRRKVALKVIKPGMDTKQVIARFEAERQALAMMDHPNIARVFDAGATDAGRPYFVMELVPGVPITRYCDEHALDTRERLALFVQVCDAVQHAHTKGIIHRDLKPTNVLVMVRDGRPVPKVIDFGMAKAAGQQRLTERTLFTHFGQLAGTPLYMSPEQAQMGGLDVDTRSDVYSLGVLLYELLTGSTPFDRQRLGKAAMDEVRRILREEDPPKPSTRLSTAAAVPSVAAKRGLELRRLSGLVRGELDWIVMKAMEKDRARRYKTAHGLEMDVQRYLRDETVQACPPWPGYHLRKLVRRHRGPVLAAMLVMLALVVGIIGTTWGMFRATEARAAALREAGQKASAVKDREAALVAARQSQRGADERLFESYLAQARANRLSRRPGQRFESLEVLKLAAELARSLDLPAEKFQLLRNAVVATLALPDLYLAGPWNDFPADTYGFDFDEAHALYARTSRKGDCSVRRVADDVELHHLPGLGLPAAPVLSRDGRFLAVLHIRNERPGKLGAAVHLWELGQPTAHRIRSEVNARDVDFRPDGRQVALAYNDGTIGVFELPGGQPLGRPLAPDMLTREVAVSLHPTEPLVAVCSYFGRVVQIRDLRTGEVVASLPQTDPPTHAAWHPDGRTLAVGYGTASPIRLYDRTTLQPYRTLDAGEQWGVYLSFNHAGDRLAANGWGSMVELFDVGTGRRLFATAGGNRRFSRDDRRLAGGVQGGRVGIWQVGDGRECRTLVRRALPPATGYRAAAVHPDGRLLAVGMDDGFGLWDLGTGSEVAFVPLNVGNRGVTDVCFERSGALLTAGLSGVFRWPLGRAAGPSERLTIGPPQRLLPCAEYLGQSRDGRVVVGSSRAVGTWQAYAGGWIWRADQPDKPIRIEAGADLGYITVSPDGQWVVTVQFEPAVAKVWDARDGRLVRRLAEWGAGYPHFSADGQWLATDTDGGRLLAVGSWEPGPRVGGKSGVFAPDGRILAVGAGAGVTRLIDRATGRELARLEDPDTDTTRMALFTPDGTQLVGLCEGKFKGIRVWDLRLIRRHLKAMGLDWDGAEFPPADPGQDAVPPTGPAPEPPKVDILLGT